jgi:predicted site-specific integrase-resolvase
MEPSQEPRLISPGDLIGSGEVMELLGIDHRSTLKRRIEAGTIPYLAQLDGPGGPYVFDRHDIERLAAVRDER